MSQGKYVQEKIQESKSGLTWLYFGVIFGIVCSQESMSVIYVCEFLWNPHIAPSWLVWACPTTQTVADWGALSALAVSSAMKRGISPFWCCTKRVKNMLPSGYD